MAEILEFIKLAKSDDVVKMVNQIDDMNDLIDDIMGSTLKGKCLEKIKYN